MKIILKAVLENKIDSTQKDVIFYQFYGCKTTADFFSLMGRSRLYPEDLSRAIKLGIEIEITGVGGQDLFPVSSALDSKGLKCNSSYNISVVAII